MIFKPKTEQLLLKSAWHDRASGGLQGRQRNIQGDRSLRYSIRGGRRQGCRSLLRVRHERRLLLRLVNELSMGLRGHNNIEISPFNLRV